jgi:Ni,Fe-hydrogenase III small subunit
MRDTADPAELFEGRHVPASSNGGQAGSGSPARVWRLQFGPCWCRGVPASTGSFDFVRLVTSENDLGQFDRNILILSERVIDGSLAVYRQVIDRIPDPKLVVSVSACPAARNFWDELPLGWSPIADVLPIDIRIDDCISGMPESLMAALLRHVTSASSLEDRSQDMAISMGG